MEPVQCWGGDGPWSGWRETNSMRVDISLFLVGRSRAEKRWKQVKFLPKSNSSAKGFGVSESWVFKLGLGLKLSLPSPLDFEFSWEPHCFPSLQVKSLSSQYLISWFIINIFPYPPPTHYWSCFPGKFWLTDTFILILLDKLANTFRKSKERKNWPFKWTGKIQPLEQ